MKKNKMKKLIDSDYVKVLFIPFIVFYILIRLVIDEIKNIYKRYMKY